MNTTNTLPAVNVTTEPKAPKAKKEYPSKSFIEYAEKSGIAAKVVTAKNNGLYPVTFANNGTGIVTSFIYTLATKANSEKIKPESFLSTLATVEKDNFSTAIGKKLLSLLSLLPKKYGNYKTLRNRLLGDIKKGVITGFNSKEGTDTEYSKMKSVIG